MTSVYTCIIVQLEHQPFGCQDHIFTWKVKWTNIHASTRRFCRTLEGTFIFQIEEGLVWLEIVSLSVVIDNFFKDQGLMKNDHDHNMYYKIKNGNILILLLYVDDFLFIGNFDKEMQ
jgi:hypothetical protein